VNVDALNPKAGALIPDDETSPSNVEILPRNVGGLTGNTETQIGKPTGTRIVKTEMTAQEKTARDALIAAIAPVQTAAKRKFTGDQSALRHAYFIGEPLASDTLEEVSTAAKAIRDRLTAGAGSTPPQDVLPGIKAAQIQSLADAITQYGVSTGAQSDQRSDNSKALEAIVTDINVLAGPRHQVQLAAEQAFPWRTPGVAAIRQSFLLPTDRPLAG